MSLSAAGHPDRGDAEPRGRDRVRGVSGLARLRGVHGVRGVRGVPGLARLRAEADRLRARDRCGLLGGVLAGACVWAQLSGVVPTPFAGEAAFGRSAPSAAAGVAAGVLALLALASYGGWTAWLVITDLRSRRLPNVILAWASGSVIGLLTAAQLVGGAAARLPAAALTAGTVLVVFLALWLGVPGAVGAGDVKLVPLTVFVAAIPGPAAVLVVFLGVLALGTASGAVLARVRGRAAFGYGPVLLLASWASALLGMPGGPGSARVALPW